MSAIKIMLTKVQGKYAFDLVGELNNGDKISGRINASDLFSIMSLDQYHACVKNGQSVFFMQSYELLKPHIYES